MERDLKQKNEAQARLNAKRARSQGLALSDHIFVNTAKGKRYFIKGNGQPKGGQSDRKA